MLSELGGSFLDVCLPGQLRNPTVTINRLLRIERIPYLIWSVGKSEEETMENTLAVGIDPGKWTNYGVAIIYPEKILLSKSFPNTWEGILEFDRQVTRVAQKRMLDIIYGIEGIEAVRGPCVRFFTM